MKPLLTTLSIFTLATSSATLISDFNTIFHNNNTIINNQHKKQQNTIYIDKNGNQVTTSQRNLSEIDSKEIIQIGFFQNQKNEIQVVRMPITIEKIPTQLPPAITSLKNMFTAATKFNQDISKWDVSHVTNMKLMFLGATTFNQDISKWDVSHVTNMVGMFDLTLFNQNIGN